MASYVSIRGWIECGHDLIEAVVLAVKSFNPAPFRIYVSPAQYALYMEGWKFPTRPVNWTAYCFYGCDIQRVALPVLEAQLEMLAGLSEELCGYFHIDSDDDDDIPEVWEIKNGLLQKRKRSG